MRVREIDKDWKHRSNVTVVDAVSYLMVMWLPRFHTLKMCSLELHFILSGCCAKLLLLLSLIGIPRILVCNTQLLTRSLLRCSHTFFAYLSHTLFTAQFQISNLSAWCWCQYTQYVQWLMANTHKHTPTSIALQIGNSRNRWYTQSRNYCYLCNWNSQLRGFHTYHWWVCRRKVWFCCICGIWSCHSGPSVLCAHFIQCTSNAHCDNSYNYWRLTARNREQCEEAVQAWAFQSCLPKCGDILLQLTLVKQNYVYSTHYAYYMQCNISRVCCCKCVHLLASVHCIHFDSFSIYLLFHIFASIAIYKTISHHFMHHWILILFLPMRTHLCNSFNCSIYIRSIAFFTF